MEAVKLMERSKITAERDLKAMRALTPSETRHELGHIEEVDGRRYGPADVDVAVAALIASGEPEPQNRKGWRRLRAKVRMALRKGTVRAR